MLAQTYILILLKQHTIKLFDDTLTTQAHLEICALICVIPIKYVTSLQNDITCFLQVLRHFQSPVSKNNVPPTLNLTDRINKSKRKKKMHLLKQPAF